MNHLHKLSSNAYYAVLFTVLKHSFATIRSTAVLMDVFTRSIRGWQLARSMEVELTLVALRRALARGRPEIHHSDQGVQYAAKEYTALLKEEGIEISNSPAGIQERQR